MFFYYKSIAVENKEIFNLYWFRYVFTFNHCLLLPYIHGIYFVNKLLNFLYEILYHKPAYKFPLYAMQHNK